VRCAALRGQALAHSRTAHDVTPPRGDETGVDETVSFRGLENGVVGMRAYYGHSFQQAP